MRMAVVKASIQLVRKFLGVKGISSVKYLDGRSYGSKSVLLLGINRKEYHAT